MIERAQKICGKIHSEVGSEVRRKFAREVARTQGALAVALLAVACGGGGETVDGGAGSSTEGDASSGASGGSESGDGTAAPTTGASETDGDEVGPITVTWEDLALVLRRGDDVLLRFPADGLQLGAVAAIDDALSYDPVYLQPDRWLDVVSAEPLAGDAAVDLRLRFADDASARLTVTEVAPGRFAASLVPEPGGPPLAFLRLRPVVDVHEGFYGLGEHFDAPEHRGRVRALQLEYDADLEGKYNEAHVPVPLVIGTRGWGMFVASAYPAVFDVAAAQDDRVAATFGVGAGAAAGLEFHLYAAAHPLDVVRHYYATTGAPLLPAPWALGPWIWRDENEDQAQVEADIAQIRALDLATSAIWIDRPYASAVGVFDWDPAKFDDAAAMTAKIHALGFRLGLWHVPYIEDVPAAAALRGEAEAQGYFPPKTALLTSPWGEPIDLTNVAAFAWWQQLIRGYTDAGVEGFKLDYAEDVTVGLGGARTPWEFADGSDERTMHRGYKLLYHRVYAETLPAAGGFLLARAGTWGDQRNVSVIWPGDLDANMAKHREAVDEDGEQYVAVGGLPAAVAASLGLGPSGFPFFASDTGGYRHSPPDRETFTRWFQFTALTPVMQVGNSASQMPWELNGGDDEMLGWYRDYARLHMRLFPYVWTYAQRLADDGRPLQRPLGLAYPELGVHPADTYLLGDELLVAPVVERGATKRALTLPPGGWVDWWTGELREGGGEVTVAAPLATLPLFQRAGGIVPLLRPTIDTLSPTTDPSVDSFAGAPGSLYVRVVPAAEATRFDVYDGARIEQRLTDAALELAFTPGGVFGVDDGATLEVIAAPKISGVMDGDAALTERADAAALAAAKDGWTYTDALGGTLTVKLQPGAHVLTAARAP